MKRLLLSAAMAFCLHGLLFGIDPQWMTPEPPKWNQPTPVSVTLSYIERETPPDPAFPIPTSPPKVAEPKPKPVSKPAPRSEKKTPPLEKREVPPPVTETSEPELPLEPHTAVPPHTAEVAEPVREQPGTGTSTDLSALSPEPATLKPPEPTVVEARPLYRQSPPPRYPRLARKRGYEGTVILEVLVDRDGDVEDLKVHQSSGYKVLDKAALASVKRWIFTPGRRGDDVVDMWVRVPIAFRLTE
ncbi:Ferric siderophore transport system, periplasmic binding protein TonB [Olavius algarvensis associated proteobacterium Delta 3]|nr:Ferric siderophore transport system, periplasmic binding protein TonB [Olavius algarvensis associated proteobacterium Delta 3]CAB5164560.1 Ferric siderophore transport system, periplasmic binding protein TonB [Olavius algarvensis associated proteobacterium Delta 3]